MPNPTPTSSEPVVLVVEDDGIIAAGMELLLTVDARVSVRLARSNREARAALADGVDFVFLDVNVEDGDTFALARELRSDGVPFVFLSGSSQTVIPPDLLTACFLAKPTPGRRMIEAMHAGVARSNRGVDCKPIRREG